MHDKWLIISYFSNFSGMAASHHIDDRLPYFRNENIETTVLSSFVGKKHKDYQHIQVLSFLPSGLRYELKHAIRASYKKRAIINTLKTLVDVVLLPFYLIEKLLMRFDAEWSWFLPASIVGIVWVLRHKPQVIYATGGPSSANLAGLIISKCTGVPLVIEFQDPVTFQYPDTKPLWHKHNLWLERKFNEHAILLVFLTQKAMETAKKRLPRHDNLTFIYSGASLTPMPNKAKSGKTVFSHIGTLHGSRNLSSLLKAFEHLCRRDPSYQNQYEIILVGHCGKNILQEIDSFPYKNNITLHGKLSRQRAFDEMQNSDILLLIQNADDVSVETIPSKMFEYVQANRPILGLVYHNDEIKNILTLHGHYAHELSDTEGIAESLKQIIDLDSISVTTADFTVEKSVQKLLRATKEKL